MNLSISSINVTHGNIVVRGKGASGNTVTIVNGSTTLGSTTVDNNGDWQITFPAAGNGSFTVQSAGKEENVNMSVQASGHEATVTTTTTIPITGEPVTAGSVAN